MVGQLVNVLSNFMRAISPNVKVFESLRRDSYSASCAHPVITAQTNILALRRGLESPTQIIGYENP
jgi:hypothetical protein